GRGGWRRTDRRGCRRRGESGARGRRRQQGRGRVARPTVAVGRRGGRGSAPPSGRGRGLRGPAGSRVERAWVVLSWHVSAPAYNSHAGGERLPFLGTDPVPSFLLGPGRTVDSRVVRGPASGPRRG